MARLLRPKSLLAWFSLILFMIGPNEVPAAEAELIVLGAKVFTAVTNSSLQSALAIAGGRIVAVGSEAEVLSHRTPQTEVVNAAGRLVIPGLIDSHAHPADASLTEFDHPIPTLETIAQVLDHVRERAQAVPEGNWIEIRQVFITRLREQRYPTRAELDLAAPRHPVLFATGPDASLNSLALQRSGIDRNFTVTDGGGGFAERDPVSGELTGILRNCTRYVKITSTRSPIPRAAKVRRLQELFADYNTVGITGVCDRDANLDDLDTYQELHHSGGMTVRTYVSHHIESIGALAGVLESIRQVRQHPLFQKGDDWLRIIGVKTYLDGGMLTGSAYLREPWGVSSIYAITDPNYRGVRFIPQERLVALVRTAFENDLQFTAHSVGDGAVHALLDAYAAVQREAPLRPAKACISHSNFMSREAAEQAARLGVVIDIQPAWLHHDAHTLLKQFGYERMRYFQPLHSLFEAGVAVGGGSDHMQKIGSRRSINVYNPFLGMATAVTRQPKIGDRRVHPEEALTREQAIRFYTINNARVLGCADRIGSLEVGKLADFAILENDLLTCPEAELANAKVWRTYAGGKLLYRAEP